MPIYEEWLLSWDKVLQHKIILLVDNCTANTTSSIQPCEEII